jgi:hypothetical protein
MRRSISLGAIALAWLVAGCGPATPTPVVEPPPPEPAAPPPPGPVERARFQEAMNVFMAHDRARDWNEASCTATVAALLGAGVRGSAVPAYNAALVEQRCGNLEAARSLLQGVLDADPTFHPARAALALYVASKPGWLDAAIEEMTKAVHDSQYTNVEALVALATFQMRRGNQVSDDEGADDEGRAHRNLGRALAVDDRYLPALDQLALLHLARARRAAAGSAAAGKNGKTVATQALELAALVCAQGIRKDPRYAHIHNTAGLVQLELGDLSRAASEFGAARRLDPRFVEAQLNFAAVNMQFHGFGPAEEAYRAVLAVKPGDYDAQLGLALAIRGQLGVSADPAQVEAAEALLAAAEKAAPDRPEAYYNHAILVQEYGAKSDDTTRTQAELLRAKTLYNEFLDRSARGAGFVEARERAKERLQEIDDMCRFLASAPPAPKRR